jgi:hypothetical protein
MRLGMANFGGLGFEGSECGNESKPGVEFPVGSHENFFGTDIWVGGVRGGDTLVSTTLGPSRLSLGPSTTWEFHTEAFPYGAFSIRTRRDTLDLGPLCHKAVYGTDAISEQDLLTVSYDTLTDPQFTDPDPFDTRQHKPLGLRLRQSSYAWSYPYAEDFVIVQWTVTNIDVNDGLGVLAPKGLRDVYIGLALAGGALNSGARNSAPDFGVEDDIIGVLESWPLPGYPALREPLTLIWVADNDGDPDGDVYGTTSTTASFGIRLLQPATDSLRVSFNWWRPDLAPELDWGPVSRHSSVLFPTSGIGTPLGDRARYQIMSNGEFDYPQVETAMNHEAYGWFPPPNKVLAIDIANGLRTFCLLSFGPFDLNPGDSVSFAIAAIGGEDSHTDALNFANFFDPLDPSAYLERLDFSDLAHNAQQAAWTYDNPGVDTDGDGYRGAYYIVGEDTVYYRGDGVPDFKGPPPPNPPGMRLTSREGEVTIRFNGRRTETEQDAFSHRVDFEGYRLYMSRTGRRENYAMLVQRDLVNYARYTWNGKKEKWEFKDPPYRLDSLKKLYDSLSLIHYLHAFHPDSFDVALVEKALLVDVLDPNDPSILDTFFYYFGPYEGNQTPNDKVLAQTVEAGIPVTGVIRKVYPDAKIEDTLYRDDGAPFLPYYEYEYVIDHLQLAEPVFFALTAFDHGDPISGLEPLESSVTLNAQEVWAINSAEVVKSTRPKPGVYPNPYKFSEYYNAQGWENPKGFEPDPERARKVTFFNVPDTCVVSIWSLDGDLVRRLEHRENPENSAASVVVWNLITRNTQAVKTGVYLYSIESRFGVDTGKLVIIK